VKNNIPLRLSFLYIGFCFFAALFTYFLIPDKTRKSKGSPDRNMKKGRNLHEESNTVQ
jgi:hypothetical protein